MLDKTLSVVLPAFNEVGNVRRAVEAARLALPKLTKEWEIILVNDGSTDGTRAVCDELAELYPEVRAAHHPKNIGYGAALRTGFAAARFELLFFMDADGQFDLNELIRFEPYCFGHDIVMGYRGDRKDSAHRRVNAWCWNKLVRLLLGVKARDIDCAFKLFRRSVIEQMKLRSTGAMINAEIISRARRLGMSMREVEVTHYPRAEGKSSGASPRVIVKALWELVKTLLSCLVLARY